MIIRSSLLLIPLALWAWYIIQPERTSRDSTASFLGFVWVFLSVLMLSTALVSTRLLQFQVNDSLFYGVPLDWVFAVAIATGALGPLSRLFKRELWMRITGEFGLIFLYCFSNLSDPYQVIWATILFSAIAALPAMWLADWTAVDSNIGKRSFLQSLAWAALLFWFFPSVIFHLTADNWSGLLARDTVNVLLILLPLLLPAYILISALVQFAVEGDGTAFPYDPPKRLVTNGVYQYISNPMQVGITLSMGWWGVVIQSIWVSISAIIAVVLFVVFKDVCNGSCAIGRDNKEWEAYQHTVPKWFPRIKF